MNSLKNFLYQKATLSVLSYLTKHKRQSFTVAEIAEAVLMSESQVKSILEDFCQRGIIECQILDQTNRFMLQEELMYVQAFRLFEDAIELNALVQAIKDRTRKIVLLDHRNPNEGKYASKISVFIQMDQENHKYIYDAIKNLPMEREIDPIVMSTSQILKLSVEDTKRFAELNSGIVLWEK